MPESPVNEIDLSKTSAPSAGDLTLEQWRAECRAFEERISASYERQFQMVSAFLEDVKRHNEVMLELGKEVLRWFKEREQKSALRNSE